MVEKIKFIFDRVKFDLFDICLCCHPEGMDLSIFVGFIFVSNTNYKTHEMSTLSLRGSQLR